MSPIVFSAMCFSCCFRQIWCRTFFMYVVIVMFLWTTVQSGSEKWQTKRVTSFTSAFDKGNVLRGQNMRRKSCKRAGLLQWSKPPKPEKRVSGAKNPDFPPTQKRAKGIAGKKGIFWLQPPFPSWWKMGLFRPRNPLSRLWGFYHCSGSARSQRKSDVGIVSKQCFWQTVLFWHECHPPFSSFSGV